MTDMNTLPATVYQVVIDVALGSKTIRGITIGRPRQTLLEAKADLERHKKHFPDARVRASTDFV